MYIVPFKRKNNKRCANFIVHWIFIESVSNIIDVDLKSSIRDEEEERTQNDCYIYLLELDIHDISTSI